MEKTTKNRPSWLQRVRHFLANLAIVAGAVAVDGDDGENHKYYACPVMVPLNGS